MAGYVFPAIMFILPLLKTYVSGLGFTALDAGKI
jgi:hypothetical protein